MARSFGQRASKKQERRVARDIGGRTTSASGATDSPSQKGDARLQGQLRVECKTTTQRSYSLTLADWRKIQSQAATFGETPVMQIQFQGDVGQHTKLAIIDWHRFEQLRAASAALDIPAAGRQQESDLGIGESLCNGMGGRSYE